MKETHDFLKDNNNKRQGDDNDRGRSNGSSVSHGRSRGRFGSSAGKANVDADQSSEQSRGRSRKKGALKGSSGKISAQAADQTVNQASDQAARQTRSHKEDLSAGNKLSRKLPRLILAFMIWIATISGVWFFFYKIGTFDRMAAALTEAVEGFHDLSVYDQDIDSGNSNDAGSNKNEIKQ